MKTLAVIVICFVSFIVIAQEKKHAEIKIIVSDFEDNRLEGEQIIFLGQITKKEYVCTSNSEGEININIEGGDTYEIKIKSLEETDDYNTIYIPTLGVSQTYPASSMVIKLDSESNVEIQYQFTVSGSSEVMEIYMPKIDDSNTTQNVKKIKKQNSLVIPMILETIKIINVYLSEN